jgi:hypothetical protein
MLAGFGPRTANMFKNIVGLDEATWKVKKVPLTQESKLSTTNTKATTPINNDTDLQMLLEIHRHYRLL